MKVGLRSLSKEKDPTSAPMIVPKELKEPLTIPYTYSVKFIVSLVFKLSSACRLNFTITSFAGRSDDKMVFSLGLFARIDAQCQHPVVFYFELVGDCPLFVWYGSHDFVTYIT